jgi:cytochrome c-type biogenesis protein CcmH
MRKRRSLLIFLAVIAILGSIWSYALLTRPPQQTLDQRVHDVASQLKCLVCQGESVADSPATLSQQMRENIRQQLQSGKSEPEVIQYFVSRYGDRILLSPPSQGFTLLAWLVPIALLLGGTLLLFGVLRNWHTQSSRGSIENDAAESEDMNESDMAYYQQQVEQELAAEDPVLLDIHLTDNAAVSSSAQVRRNEVFSRLGTEDD